MCLLPLRTVARQATLIDPQLDTTQEQVWQTAFRVPQSDPELDAARRQWHALTAGDPDEQVISSWRAGNPAGSLPTYARLLVLLRGRHAVTRPADQLPPSDAAIVEILNGLATDPPLRLRLVRQREQVVAALKDQGLGARHAELLASSVHWVTGGIAASSRPVIRELCDRLLTEAEAWRIEGRAQDARLADETVVRLLTDIVRDSPTPDVALLAVEWLPTACRDLGATQAAEAAERFRSRWHASIGDDETSLLPNLGSPPLAASEHDRALRWLFACIVALTASCALGGFCLVFLMLTLVASRGDRAELGWRGKWWGRWLVPLAIVSPVAIVLATLGVADTAVCWLLSSRTLVCLLLLPPVLGVTIIVATWLAAEPPPTAARARLPQRILVVGLITLAVVAVLSGFLAPVQPESWRPPRGLQWFRRFGLFVSLACAGVSLFWLVWGARARRKGGLSRGGWARANLAVTAPALLMTLVLTFALLAVNSRDDRRHEEAFARAAADPIADRLGPNWWEVHFAPARALAE